MLIGVVVDTIYLNFYLICQGSNRTLRLTSNFSLDPLCSSSSASPTIHWRSAQSLTFLQLVHFGDIVLVKTVLVYNMDPK